MTGNRARTIGIIGAGIAVVMLVGGIVLSCIGYLPESTTVFAVSTVVSLGSAIPSIVIGLRNDLRRFRGEDEIR